MMQEDKEARQQAMNQIAFIWSFNANVEQQHNYYGGKADAPKGVEEIVEESEAPSLHQKIASCFTDGLLNVEDTSRLYFLLLVMWAQRLLQSKEIPAFVRMVGEAHPALFEGGRTQEKVITDLQNMNKKAKGFFDERVRDHSSLIAFVDEMYRKKKSGQRSKYGEEAVTLTNRLFLAMK